MKRHFVRGTPRKKFQTMQLSAHIVKDVGIGSYFNTPMKILRGVISDLDC